jgi:hypothetical protein
MKRIAVSRSLASKAMLALVFGALAGATFGAAQAATTTRAIARAGTGFVQSLPEGSGAVQIPEFDPAFEGLDEPDVNGRDGAAAARTSAAASFAAATGGRMVNRSIAKSRGRGDEQSESHSERPRAELQLSIDGINFRQQRIANNGNQFSIEPPDQALCVGGGFVVEAVNTVMRVFDTRGNALSTVVDLNTFYGYAPAIVRGTPTLFGPSITDPICHYDADTQRFFLVVLTFDRVGRTAALNGKSHLDIAVSTTSNPLGTWNLYRIATQNDGTDGTPVHRGIDYGNPAGADCPCFGDYPHIGADANGIYLSTNEFRSVSPRFFNAAQIYALPKRALVAGAAAINLVHFDTIDHKLQPDGTPGFTVWPAISPGTRSFERSRRGTQYFLSSQAVFNDSGDDNRLRVWALTNTRSLDSATPELTLRTGVAKVRRYAVPPPSNQKDGVTPLRECINDTTLATPFGPGCWQNLLNPPEPAHDEVIAPLDSNDSRMQQVAFADGKLWGALDTAVTVGGVEQAGIAYFALEPEVEDGVVEVEVKTQGVIAMAGNNLSYPAIAMLPNGRGVMGFTLVGKDNHPSAAYVGLDASRGAGPVKVAAPGVGPQDGFSGYKAFGAPPRPRWGDYGAAASDGDSIWLASQYVAQSCTLAQYVAAPFGSCGGTRATLGNWATRISKVTP